MSKKQFVTTLNNSETINKSLKTSKFHCNVLENFKFNIFPSISMKSSALIDTRKSCNKRYHFSPTPTHNALSIHKKSLERNKKSCVRKAEWGDEASQWPRGNNRLIVKAHMKRKIFIDMNWCHYWGNIDPKAYVEWCWGGKIVFVYTANYERWDFVLRKEAERFNDVE